MSCIFVYFEGLQLASNTNQNWRIIQFLLIQSFTPARLHKPKVTVYPTMFKQLAKLAQPIQRQGLFRAFSVVSGRGSDGKIIPHGGKIVDRMASPAEAKELLARLFAY